MTKLNSNQIVTTLIDKTRDTDHFHVYDMRNPSDRYKFERDYLLCRLRKNIKKRQHQSTCYQVKQYEKLLEKKAKENKPLITFHDKK